MERHNALEAIAAQLLDLSEKFGSASLLADALLAFPDVFPHTEGAFVLRHDEVSGEWGIHSTEDERPNAYAIGGFASPEFVVANYMGKIIGARVGFGSHSVKMGFDAGDGSALFICPDEYPSTRCWGGRNAGGKNPRDRNPYRRQTPEMGYRHGE